MRISMTGATGYIGTHVARALKRHGHEVSALVRTAAASERLTRDGIRPVLGELEQLPALQALVGDAEAVIHCGFAAVPNAVQIESAALDAMLAAVDAQTQAFVYTSGVWVYGGRGDAIVGEDAPVQPIALVAWRPAHERRVLEAPGDRLRTMVIRPGIVYGDEGGIIGGMLDRARGGEAVTVVGDGRNRWSCVRVDALAELYVLAVERARRGAIYNAVLGAAVPYVEIARAVSRAAGGDGRVQHRELGEARAAMGPFADALALDLQVSSERAKRELDWQPHRPTILEELSATTVV